MSTEKEFKEVDISESVYSEMTIGDLYWKITELSRKHGVDSKIIFDAGLRPVSVFLKPDQNGDVA